MRRTVQKNKNKQKQELKAKKIKDHTSLYLSGQAYMNITAVHLCRVPIELDVKVPYNFILRDATGLSNHEVTYLCRASDLLLLTVTGPEISHELVSLVKRYMPSAVVVYDKKQKNVARLVSKLFGDVKMCEASMLNMILEKIETKNTHLASTRPFMIPRSINLDGHYMYAQGFMKNGLKSDKLIINGLHEGVIEEVTVGTEKIPGDSLVFEENESALEKPIDSPPQSEPDSELDEEPHSEEDAEYEEDVDPMAASPGFDLITKYSEYRGIRNLATCTFSDQRKPDYYRDLVFVKNTKYILSQVRNNRSIIPKNSYVTLKIRVSGPITESIVVLFNLFEYETRRTIYNFDFSCPTLLPKDIVVDNGFRVYSSRCIVTRNLNNNVFKEESDLLNGVVSFVGPINLHGCIAHILIGGINTLNAVNLLNGRAQDRIFFECAELKGKPIKVCKSYLVVKGMFFNKEQVEYFRNIKVESRNGITGFIKKPLGTKGLFKAYFAQPVKHGDSVKMSLYKRIFL